MPDAAPSLQLTTAHDRARPAGWLGRGLRVAALLAMATTLYEVGAHFDLSGFGFPQAIGIAGTWLVHFLSACTMLWILDTGFRRAWPALVPRWSSIVLIVLACAAIGWAFQMALAVARAGYGAGPTHYLSDISTQVGVSKFLLYWNLSVAALLVAAYAAVARSRAVTEAWHELELRGVRVEREVAAARLQLLQAQVEPHFIFNALANVRRLLRTDPNAARDLLADLLRYLEEALPALRDDSSTLGREAQLMRAYLAVHQVRMGPRLRAEVDIPDALRDRPVPPMVLLTLVENALKHGLQPMVDGGSVQVRACAAEGCITLTVADTGRGMGNASGHGTGLANLRARLRATYGPAASLSLAVNEPRGVVVTVTLPERA